MRFRLKSLTSFIILSLFITIPAKNLLAQNIDSLIASAKKLRNNNKLTEALETLKIAEGFEQRLQDLEKELNSVKEDLASTQDKLTKIALTKSRQALDAARKGHFTNAEIFFASSIATLGIPVTIKVAELFLERYNMQSIEELFEQA